MTTNHTDLIRRLYASAQGVELGADGMGWSPDPALYREAADALEAMQAKQPSECNDNDSPWLVCKPCVATGKCAKAEQPSVREPLTAALDALEENARLLGITQARKEFGTYSQDDARFERAFYEGIYKHRRAIEAMHGIGVKGEA